MLTRQEINSMGAGDLLAYMRADAWRVAAHNDYTLNGEDLTFWLFTHPNGFCAKGEGKSDLEALRIVALNIIERFKTP